MDFTLCRLNVKFFAFLFAKEKEIRIFAVVNFGQTGFISQTDVLCLLLFECKDINNI